MKQIYNVKSELPEIKNSFSWTEESMNDRVPTQLKKYGFKQDENLHLYLVVALHPLYNLKKHFGTVDIPRDEVLKSTYAAIDKGCEIINHLHVTNPDYMTKVIDAEYESERQEYIIASNDPEIHRLIEEGSITAVSIQGKPRAYIENCGHCSTGNCECKMIAKGFVLGIKDGNSVSWVSTKDCEYFGQKIPADIPHDKNTSIEILLTEGSRTVTIDEIEKLPKEQLHMLSDVSFKPNQVNLTMSAEGDNPPKQDPPQDPPADVSAEEKLKQVESDLAIIKTVADEAKASVDAAKEELGEKISNVESGIEEIKNSIKALTATDEETKKQVEEVKNNEIKLTKDLKAKLEANPDIQLTDYEKSLLKKEAIKNEPLSSFVQ